MLASDNTMTTGYDEVKVAAATAAFAATNAGNSSMIAACHISDALAYISSAVKLYGALDYEVLSSCLLQAQRAVVEAGEAAENARIAADTAAEVSERPTAEYEAGYDSGYESLPEAWSTVADLWADTDVGDVHDAKVDVGADTVVAKSAPPTPEGPRCLVPGMFINNDEGGRVESGYGDRVETLDFKNLVIVEESHLFSINEFALVTEPLLRQLAAHSDQMAISDGVIYANGFLYVDDPCEPIKYGFGRVKEVFKNDRVPIVAKP
ncbi:hypothetical protein ASPVEDRAFT_882772 [Aspergillus versicolor CBS 583.65]|uniref:Uncharacterized protein n=1 Tax=Aspergillus versicolor CBS 583.65 TaxID=1036611 RepID=A0A1L9PD45_ASPVE|nr:uncharacterized protein ASPVEDRAFT_882772 [Aspergillus versicolor CBS 583.65]OJI99403.1 hypothetical protein ASPVEDRAFT_882772 [Aspergillus versicolor CBS 583.65]